MNKDVIIFRPIGQVKTEATEAQVRDKNTISKIVLHPELIEALEGITEYSHLFILFYLNKLPDEQRKLLKVHPRGKQDLPLLGIFAVRSKSRPNPIGLTLVKLIKVEQNILTVQGLDALDETPVLDIKPFDPWDTAENIRLPKWWNQLERQKT